MNKKAAIHGNVMGLTDADAEIACIQGGARVLAQYFKETVTPAACVLENIALCLLANNGGAGPGDWILRFRTRNGRPPTGRPYDDIGDPLAAIAAGQAVALGRYLYITAAPTIEVLRAMSTALDAKGASKWMLTFHRPHIRRPGTDLRHDLEFYETQRAVKAELNKGEAPKQICHTLKLSLPTVRKAVGRIKAAERMAGRISASKNPPT